jgi:hypothetical protein
MQMLDRLGSGLDKKEVAKLHSINVDIGYLEKRPTYVDGDGRFVRFDMEKVDLRGTGYFECKQYGPPPLETLPPPAP